MSKDIFVLLDRFCKKIEASDRIIDRTTIPSTGGVYFIKNKKGVIRYVGKAKKLKRRIGNHYSGDVSKSIFVKKIGTERGISKTSELKKHIVENYDFYIVEIINPDERSLVEDLLIYKYRKFLLNS